MRCIEFTAIALFIITIFIIINIIIAIFIIILFVIATKKSLRIVQHKALSLKFQFLMQKYVSFSSLL